MKNEEKIIELLAEMVRGQDRLVGEVSEMKEEIISVKGEIQQMNVEIMKQGLQTAENSRAILKLADEIRLVAEHEKRISKLELTVFK
ncbi:MAG: hypothetical protein KF725_12945 [Cyclobacteriaceae bacterium]|nr:hypothetical protein [Cyclobacteriaceae bacterium]UYN85464.1 MAG: hypothetical protein KIT51_11270 [Cyclobacteriaceae bacterium]